MGEIVLRESLARESTIDLPYVEYEDVIAEEGRINKDIRKKEGIKREFFLMVHKCCMESFDHISIIG